MTCLLNALTQHSRTTIHTQAWSSVVETLGSDHGLQTFLDAMVGHYVRVCNAVLAVSQSKTPDEVKLDMDDAQFEIEEDVSHDIFTKAWNDAVKSGGMEGAQIETFVEREWRWVLAPLIVACREAFAAVVRVQFDDLDIGDQDHHVYVGDKTDSRHRYYVVGVVLRSVLTHFSRIKSAVETMFLSKEEASAQKLPVQEINARTFKSLLYANRAALRHFSQLCDKYREVCYWNGRLCVKDAMVLRYKTKEVLADQQMLAAFNKLGKFHPDDVQVVYDKYVHRVETLMGHDVARQYMDLLSKSKDGVLEQLRAVKVQKAAVIKAGMKRKRRVNRDDDYVY